MTRQAVDSELGEVVQDLSSRGAAGDLYSVVALGLRPDTNTFASAGVDPSDVPAELFARAGAGAGPAVRVLDPHPGAR